MFRSIFALVLFTFLFFKSSSQQLIFRTSENFIVHSQLNGSGNKNLQVVTLPEGTVGYVYRFKATKSKEGVEKALFSALQQIPIPQIKAGAALAELALETANTMGIHYYIFDDYNNAMFFMNTKDAQARCCSYGIDRGAKCEYVSTCLRSSIYIVFYNTNLTTALNVSFEAVAIVGNKTQNENPSTSTNTSPRNSNNTNRGYKYTITNDADIQVNFQLMANVLDTRYDFFLYAGYHDTYTFPQSEIVFLLKTKGSGKAKYTIYPNVDYHIRWNEEKKKWDLYNE